MPDKHILVVEDDQPLRETLVELLELEGYEVTQAANGIEFYTVFPEVKDYKVAIIDIGLPDQSGLVLAEYVRKNSEMSIIILTANDSLDNRVETFKNGADLFLPKPFYNSELLAAVAALVQRTSERRKVPQPTPNQKQMAPTNEAPLVWNRRNSKIILPDGPDVLLNHNESVLMAHFAENPVEIVNRRALMKSIYSRDDESAAHALDNMIRRFRKKLEVFQHDDDTPLILTIYGKGYRITCPFVTVE
jgi:DNA-binding response OmpR family regulator